MKRNIALVLSLAILTILTSCNTRKAITNGAYSDISLTRDSKEYSIKRLSEVKSESKAVFGIPTDKNLNKKQSIIVRFNGINLMASKRIVPMISMAALSFFSGSIISDISGYNNKTGNNKISLPVGIIAGLPVAGAINNQIWSGSLSRAAWDLNSQLVGGNPDVDVFLNPKYDIQLRKGIWTQKAVLKAKVMGATIKTDQ